MILEFQCFNTRFQLLVRFAIASKLQPGNRLFSVVSQIASVFNAGIRVSRQVPIELSRQFLIELIIKMLGVFALFHFLLSDGFRIALLFSIYIISQVVRSSATPLSKKVLSEFFLKDRNPEHNLFVTICVKCFLLRPFYKIRSISGFWILKDISETFRFVGKTGLIYFTTN